MPHCQALSRLETYKLPDTRIKTNIALSPANCIGNLHQLCDCSEQAQQLPTNCNGIWLFWNSQRKRCGLSIKPITEPRQVSLRKLTCTACMQVMCVTGGAQLFQDADVGLCYYESEVDDYIPVACTLQADSAGNMLMTTVSFSLLLCPRHHPCFCYCHHNAAMLLQVLLHQMPYARCL